ncbi:hypothetical protein PGT21_032205 [Puccinia graminis f. sp. tritici]|uniref:Uncharacterized protein n=1 Tax=Puccinia graminis f. sp. tritici TaxID=56615 RepID=A0A5B0LQW7_PUCGR|nr:hypothetical protein PGT21_032205 [Puccinia graminis f. sp. tritici]
MDRTLPSICAPPDAQKYVVTHNTGNFVVGRSTAALQTIRPLITVARGDQSARAQKRGDPHPDHGAHSPAARSLQVSALCGQQYSDPLSGQSPSEESSWLEEGEMEEWVEMNEGVREAKSTNTASEMDSMDNFSLGHHWTHHWNPHGLEVTPLWTHITKPIPSQAHFTTLKSPLSYAYTQLTVYT